MSIKNVIKKVDDELEKVEIEQDKMRELEVLKDYEGKDEIITSEQAEKELEEERKKPTTKFLSQIPTLDKLLDGFREGDVVVISAPTKMGKTSFAQTLTCNFAQKDIPCLWFSWELMQRDFLQKFGQPIPHFLLPKNLTGNSISWITEKVVESIAKYGTKIVFLDHLHYIIPLEAISQRAGISLLIGGLMRELKKLAIRWGICIFLIAHTTKTRFEEAPQLSDIRDSSFISQEADTVLMIWRKREKGSEEFTNESRLVVQANRRTGSTGGINLIFNQGKFYEKCDL